MESPSHFSLDQFRHAVALTAFPRELGRVMGNYHKLLEKIVDSVDLSTPKKFIAHIT